MKEKKVGFEEKKELTHAEKVYALGEVTAGLIELHLEEPAVFTKAGILKTIFDKYEDLGLDLDKLSKEG